MDFLENEPYARAERIVEDGMVKLGINGRAVYPMIMMSPWGEGEKTERGGNRIRHTAETGIHLYVTQQFLDLAAFTEMWYNDHSYCFDGLDRDLISIVENDHEAHIILKIYVQPPLWWMEKHPEEAVGYADGFVPHKKTVFCGDENGYFPSVASEKWKQDSGDMLRALIAHLDQTLWGKRVIGINLLNGLCQEWHYWGSVHNHLPDCSPCMVRKFRNFLTDKYQSDEALRKAWKREDVTLGTAEVPSVAERDSTSFHYFRDPVKEAPIIDYYQCQHDATYQAITYFARVVKEASNGRMLTGVYYGYVFTCPWYNDGVSMAVSRILSSPEVDFLASPAAYEDYLSRGVGGDSLLRGLPDSCRLNGKLYISETDEGTFMCPKTYHECERMENFEESVANLRKEFGQLLTRRAGNWWFDLDDDFGLFIHEPHKEELTRLKKIADYALNVPKRSNQMALVTSVESLYYVAHTMDAVTYPYNDVLPHLLSRSGIPFDIITTEELKLTNCPDYKLYLFNSLSYADSELRGVIRAKLARNHATAVWTYGAGLVDENGIDIGSASALTGINLKMTEDDVTQLTTLDLDKLGRLTPVHFGGTIRNLHIPATTEDYAEYYADGGRVEIGTGVHFAPLIYAEDSEAECFGTVSGTNFCGLARKEANGITNWYSSSLITSTELLRAIARTAGVFVYHEDCVSMIDNQFLCFPVRDDDRERMVRLPYPCVVKDMITGETICEKQDHFLFAPKKRTTYLFEYQKQ